MYYTACYGNSVFLLFSVHNVYLQRKMAQGQKVYARDSHMKVMLIVVTLLSSSPFIRR